MNDVFDSNGFLPLQYILNANQQLEDEYFQKNSPVTKILKTLKNFRSEKYQTEQLIHVGIWKSVSNIHS